MRSFRLLECDDARPAWNMAVDQALLESAVAPTLRLYAFGPPGITLGYFQEAPAAPDLPAIRRLTGGGAIRHEGELTFTIALPAGDPLYLPDVRASYAALLRPFRAALEALGAPTAHPAAAAGEERFLCFRRASPIDLAWRGRKLLGSAQRRAREGLLMHGVVYLGSAPATEAASVSEAAGRPVAWEELAAAVREAFPRALGAALDPAPLTRAERAAAARLERERYGSSEWNESGPARRASPRPSGASR
jgi:lipoate-protein ligase A